MAPFRRKARRAAGNRQARDLFIPPCWPSLRSPRRGMCFRADGGGPPTWAARPASRCGYELCVGVNPDMRREGTQSREFTRQAVASQSLENEASHSIGYLKRRPVAAR